MGLLHGRAGRLTGKHGGFRPGQELKSDTEIVTAAVSSFGQALRYANDDAKSNKDVVLAAVAADGWALQHAHATLKADVHVVTAAVNQTGMALSYAADVLRQNKAVVAAAVAQNGNALQHAHGAFKSDKDLVIAALKLCPTGHARNREKEMEGSGGSPDPPGRFPTRLHTVSMGCSECLPALLNPLAESTSLPQALKHVSDELKQDRGVLMMAVTTCGNSLRFAPLHFQSDKDIVHAAVSQNGCAGYP
jgi:hypothetical protein